jgi:hypothetical protein
MLALLCRAINETESAEFKTVVQDTNRIDESLGDAHWSSLARRPHALMIVLNGGCIAVWRLVHDHGNAFGGCGFKVSGRFPELCRIGSFPAVICSDASKTEIFPRRSCLSPEKYVQQKCSHDSQGQAADQVPRDPHRLIFVFVRKSLCTGRHGNPL